MSFASISLAIKVHKAYNKISVYITNFLVRCKINSNIKVRYKNETGKFPWKTVRPLDVFECNIMRTFYFIREKCQNRIIRLIKKIYPRIRVGNSPSEIRTLFALLHKFLETFSEFFVSVLIWRCKKTENETSFI